MGTVFCCYLRSLHNSFVTDSGCSGNDGACKLFWGIKNLSSCCFLVATKLFSHFIGKCQCKYAVRFETSSDEEIWPISDRFIKAKILLHHCALLYSVRF